MLFRPFSRSFNRVYSNGLTVETGLCGLAENYPFYRFKGKHSDSYHFVLFCAHTYSTIKKNIWRPSVAGKTQPERDHLLGDPARACTAQGAVPQTLLVEENYGKSIFNFRILGVFKI